MEEQLINFKTATLAKEKGFKSKFRYDIVTKHNITCNLDAVYSKNEIPICTQSLLQRWLREVHNLTICIDWYQKGYYYHIFNTKEAIFVILSDGNKISNTFKTYEEALEEGLIEALKLIK